RFGEALDVVRRLLAGERVTRRGRFVEVDGAELLPRPSRPIPLMIGSNGKRMLSIALPHATHWNTWYADFDNDPERLPPLVRQVDRAWIDAGQGHRHLVKTVALHVSLTDGPRTRPGRPIAGSDDQVADRLREVEACGIEHVQLVLDPVVPGAVERAGSIRRILSGR
ncbi:MAG: LLM class flavin-dependent oxidoreductase, partial [Acidimicrobiia bacterium]|nr:LLM class flavin-dependent oxidoreductase [Acidimicrobiia bacterium]